MCGIYGIINESEKINIKSLRASKDLLKHRGPDDSGEWISKNGNIGLAHCRLSIIDLTDAGHQPMQSEDGRLVIVYNGEIYNFWLLRKKLESYGHVFRSECDTEVVLAAYSHWGKNCLNYLNGMYAFAIYDSGCLSSAPSLFLARDRTGKKPLYYYLHNSSLQFASELKAIKIQTGVNFEALNYYLAFGYVPGEYCIAKGVKKLAAGHAAILELDSFKLSTWQYWKIPDKSIDLDIDVNEATDHMLNLLSDSVRMRLIGDVPVGILLSGGLDSSLVLALAAQQSSKPLMTFNISIPGSSIDESKYASYIANYFGAEHHELSANESSTDIISDFSQYVDEPIADSSILPTFLVSRLTKKYVKVALGGDGGDELFGGYPEYINAIQSARNLRLIPSNFFKFCAKAISQLPAGIKGRSKLISFSHGPLKQSIWGTPFFDVTLRKRLLNADIIDSIKCPEYHLTKIFDRGKDPVDSMTRTHFESVLIDNFLVKVDRASMANSLEIREPYLDYRIVEYAFRSIPSELKIFDGKARIIQKLIANKLLPSDFNVNRKQGFSVPLDDWLRACDCVIVREYISYLPSCIKKKEVEKLISGHMKGRANGARLFALIMLSIAMKNNNWSM